MAEQRSKSNKKFMVLSAIGIIMVVDHHTFTALNIFGDYIPYNSFFMPMFVFISGYFNNVNGDTHLPAYLWKKVKTLLIPYAGITVAVFIIQQLMDLYKTGAIERLPSGYLLYILERVITAGSPFALVTPMWFVITLFFTLTVYAVLKKLLSKYWNSFAALPVFVALQLIAVYISKTLQPETIHYYLVLLKVMFFLPFLELGIIYRDRLEKRHTGLSGGGKLGVLVILLLINMIRTMYLPAAYDVAFDSLDEMAGFTSPYIVTPLISSVVGILFWLTMVDILGRMFYDSRFVNFLSANTFWVMGFHIMFYSVLNCILMMINDCIIALPYFDEEAFRETEWYYWEISPNFKLAYLVIGVLGPLGLKYIYEKIKKKIEKEF